MAKKWLFWFCEGSVCVSGQNQMCRLCGCLKLFLKNAGRQKKIKKHWGGLSVGLLAVPFQYGLYVFGHLSKWFVFVLMFKFWSVYRLWNGRPTIGYNVLRLTAGGVLERPTVGHHKCKKERKTSKFPVCPTCGKPLLPAGIYFSNFITIGSNIFSLIIFLIFSLSFIFSAIKGDVL